MRAAQFRGVGMGKLEPMAVPRWLLAPGDKMVVSWVAFGAVVVERGHEGTGDQSHRKIARDKELQEQGAGAAAAPRGAERHAMCISRPQKAPK